MSKAEKNIEKWLPAFERGSNSGAAAGNQSTPSPPFSSSPSSSRTIQEVLAREEQRSRMNNTTTNNTNQSDFSEDETRNNEMMDQLSRMMSTTGMANMASSSGNYSGNPSSPSASSRIRQQSFPLASSTSSLSPLSPLPSTGYSNTSLGQAGIHQTSGSMAANGNSNALPALPQLPTAPQGNKSSQAQDQGGRNFTFSSATQFSTSYTPSPAIPRSSRNFSSSERRSASPETLNPDGLRATMETEKLYEAFNDLHLMAQHFQKPFDAPAVLVVGHQTDGKSALVEALMGFQFNHVGGGTKTRRPITLHMKYNPSCTQPKCFLITSENPVREEQRSLPELQAYIEEENERLEEANIKFWEKEIVVRMEYKFCPNLTIIDTPGLISAPPGLTQKAQQEQARLVEALVARKMAQKEFIILCLEDTSDWGNASTRRHVMMVDPDLSRTILVSTKLDTRIPQFSRAADVEMYLSPELAGLSPASVARRPFFTSVPSGRVGSSADAVFGSDNEFREAVLAREARDVAQLEEKLGRPLADDERSRIGVRRLRNFLEYLLQRKYMENVPYIVPLLDGEFKAVSLQLSAIKSELGNLSEPELREKGRDFRDKFVGKLGMLLRGTIAAPPERFGETLQDERLLGGMFLGSDGHQIPQRHMPNASMRLYGGAQYHRAMAEFRFVVGAVKCPVVSREEIVNACGVEDHHDGTNYFRTACVIAVSKAWDVFEPFLRQLGFRLSHIIRRLFPLVLFLLKKDGEAMLSYDQFLERVSKSFTHFVENTERSCIEKCMEDLTSTTRFVSWSLHTRNRSGLQTFFSNIPSAAMGESSYPSSSDPSPPHPAYHPPPEKSKSRAAQSGAEERGQSSSGGGGGGGGGEEGREGRAGNSGIVSSGSKGMAGGGGTSRLVDLLEGSLWSRRLAPSSEDVVTGLVSQIFDGIREHFATSAELKFNCFFLMPLLDKFPARLREDLEAATGEGMESVFDATRIRKQLEEKKRDLEAELSRVESLQLRFRIIHRNLSLGLLPSLNDAVVPS